MKRTINRMRLATLLVLSALPLMTISMPLSADRGGDREDFDLYDRNRLGLDFDPYDTEQEKKDENQQNTPRRNGNRGNTNQGNYNRGNNNYSPYSNTTQNTQATQNKESTYAAAPNLQNQEADLYDRNRLQLDFNPYDTKQEQNSSRRGGTRSDNSYQNSNQNYYTPDNNSSYPNNSYYPQQAG